MKKAINILLLITMILFLATPCFAEFQPNPKRWTWITSDSTRSIWYDSHTVHPRKENGRKEVDLWLLFYKNTPNEEIMECDWTVDLINRKLSMNNVFIYDMNWKLIDQIDDDINNRIWKPVVPETTSEKIYKIAKYYYLKKYSKQARSI
ncbi:hypothetical protein [Acidaminococcus massiliensis]|uniref:hypothetical protein n=1 Tax=Acidaminococcus massiliensis TaxID=1852375 RepID=UPI00248E68A2|nr:hypothetical protein [Acidaminococcus massiliensis]